MRVTRPLRRYAEGVPTLALVPVGSVVDLVNQYASTTRLTAVEQALPYPHLPAFDEFRVSRTQMTVAADRLHPVFADPGEAPTVLNRLVDETSLRPHVDESGALGWAVPSSRHRLLAACTAALVEWVHDKGLRRHGTCGADRCVDVYVDNSRPGTRRYCSEGCLNRDRVATWRARHRAPTPRR